MPLKVAARRSDRFLVPLDATQLACHTAVLAQSGAGKSFLIGRLIEELLLNTRFRVVVLDPNSDYVRLGDVDETAWDDPKLRAWFPLDDLHPAFSANWEKVEVRVASNRNLKGAAALQISWGRLSISERADAMEIDATSDPELYWMLELASEVAKERWDDEECPFDFEHFREVANDLCGFLLGANSSGDFGSRPLAIALRSAGPSWALRFQSLVTRMESFDIWCSAGDDGPELGDLLSKPANSPAVTVLDLLSLETEAERLVVVASALSALWDRAREDYGNALRDAGTPDLRVPTLLVIDEAHNLVPASRRSAGAERVASEVVRIAAEGRKFGLFLLVVTQRPRKVEQNVLSECDSLFLMRMTNRVDLASATELFGFVDPAVADQAKNLETGDVLLQGRLGMEPEVCHVVPRRTREGGRNLDKDHWNRPY